MGNRATGVGGSDRPIHVVGGGIAGLVAAITAAESGAPVVVHEATSQLGGRALGGTERRRVNLGPHVVFTDGALVRWLRARRIDVPLRRPFLRGARMLDDRGARIPAVDALRLVSTLPRRDAPVEQSFREWSETVFGAASADLLCRLAGLYTFHHDPGMLSARFVWERYRRTFLSPDRVRHISGGWATLIDALIARASDMGVRIETGEPVTAATWPGGPTIVATRLASASRLLERDLRWPGSRTALFDVVARAEPSWPGLVADVRSDLRTCCMLERESGELFQAQLGVAPGVTVESGVARIQDVFDRTMPGWRERVAWARGHIAVDATGAVDHPGTTWRDRPAIDQGEDRFLAGDAVAAPGLLSEVSVNSAVDAARAAVDARIRRAFPVGWPTAELSPERRLAILAAAVPGAALRTRDGAELEPVDATGIGYRLVRRAGVVTGRTSASGGQVTTFGSPGFLARVVGRRRRHR